ncbi:MAG TPA: hypothetical protein VFC23_17240 [Thermoanaerobaculia bacterium]|nr:hypothetical protein [Thermoanaerobaculia bacterium]
MTVRATSLQLIVWGDAARRQNKPVDAFIGWAADFTAAYFSEGALQALQQDPILTRLEEKKRLRRLLDAGWHALDFLPPPSRCPARGSIQDPKKDLREALEAMARHLDEVQEYL